MSVETDAAEIKSDVKNLIKRFEEQINIQKAFCQMRHEPLDEHIKDSPSIRDSVKIQAGKVTVLLALVIIIVGAAMTLLGRLLWVKMGG